MIERPSDYEPPEPFLATQEQADNLREMERNYAFKKDFKRSFWKVFTTVGAIAAILVAVKTIVGDWLWKLIINTRVGP